jgi:hypothetical protein
MSDENAPSSANASKYAVAASAAGDPEGAANSETEVDQETSHETALQAKGKHEWNLLKTVVKADAKFHHRHKKKLIAGVSTTLVVVVVVLVVTLAAVAVAVAMIRSATRAEQVQSKQAKSAAIGIGSVSVVPPKENGAQRRRRLSFHQQPYLDQIEHIATELLFGSDEADKLAAKKYNSRRMARKGAPAVRGAARHSYMQTDASPHSRRRRSLARVIPGAPDINESTYDELSDYNTATVSYTVDDGLGDALDMPNMIICMLDQTRAEEFFNYNGSKSGCYTAMVDEAKCQKQDDSQDGGGGGGGGSGTRRQLKTGFGMTHHNRKPGSASLKWRKIAQDFFDVHASEESKKSRRLNQGTASPGGGGGGGQEQQQTMLTEWTICATGPEDYESEGLFEVSAWLTVGSSDYEMDIEFKLEVEKSKIQFTEEPGHVKVNDFKIQVQSGPMSLNGQTIEAGEAIKAYLTSWTEDNFTQVNSEFAIEQMGQVDKIVSKYNEETEVGYAKVEMADGTVADIGITGDVVQSSVCLDRDDYVPVGKEYELYRASDGDEVTVRSSIGLIVVLEQADTTTLASTSGKTLPAGSVIEGFLDVWGFMA